MMRGGLRNVRRKVFKKWFGGLLTSLLLTGFLLYNWSKVPLHPRYQWAPQHTHIHTPAPTLSPGDSSADHTSVLKRMVEHIGQDRRGQVTNGPASEKAPLLFRSISSAKGYPGAIRIPSPPYEVHNSPSHQDPPPPGDSFPAGSVQELFRNPPIRGDVTELQRNPSPYRYPPTLQEKPSLQGRVLHLRNDSLHHNRVKNNPFHHSPAPSNPSHHNHVQNTPPYHSAVHNNPFHRSHVNSNPFHNNHIRSNPSHQDNIPHLQNHPSFQDPQPSFRINPAFPSHQPSLDNNPSFDSHQPSIDNNPSFPSHQPSLDNNPFPSHQPSLDNNPPFPSHQPSIENNPSFPSHQASLQNNPSFPSHQPSLHNNPSFPSHQPSLDSNPSFPSHQPSLDSDPSFPSHQPSLDSNPTQYSHLKHLHSSPSTHGPTPFPRRNPSLNNPSLSNPSLNNPSLSNPSLGNPSLGNPFLNNPSLGNPSLGNPSLTNPSLHGIPGPSQIPPSLLGGRQQTHSAGGRPTGPGKVEKRRLVEKSQGYSDSPQNHTTVFSSSQKALYGELTGKKDFPDDSDVDPRLLMPLRSSGGAGEGACFPHHHLVFIKVHKAASSTLANIIQRYGFTRNLNFVLPNRPPKSVAYNYISKRGELFNQTSILPPPPGGHYDLLWNHAIYNRTAFNSFMPHDTVYISILREPFQQFVSSYAFYNSPDMDKYLSSRVNPFSHYLYYMPHTQLLNYFRNKQAEDLGMGPQHVLNSTLRHLYLQDLNQELQLVLITEFFDESLVLLRRLLCWSIKDILYMPQNKNSFKPKFVFSGQDYARHQQLAAADYDLYKFFKHKFLRILAAQELDFEHEVTHFREVLREVRRFCQQTPLNSSRQFFVPRSPWSLAFTINSLECRMLVIHELTFLDKLLEVHKAKIQHASPGDAPQQTYNVPPPTTHEHSSPMPP